MSGSPQRRRRGGGARAGQAAQQRGVGAAAARRGAAGAPRQVAGQAGRGGAGPAPPQRAVSQRIRGGYVAERRERGRSRADARSLSSLPVKEMGKTQEEVGRCAAECLA